MFSQLHFHEAVAPSVNLCFRIRVNSSVGNTLRSVELLGEALTADRIYCSLVFSKQSLFVYTQLRDMLRISQDEADIYIQGNNN